jgi:glycerate dehydrogenase
MRIDYVRMRQRKMLLLCVLLATTRALQRPPAKVVVLDAYTATAGVFQDRDAAWRPALRAGDELVVYDRTAPSDVVERLSSADVAVVNKVLVTDSLLSAVPTLGLVSVTATGVNNVDLEACEKHGVAVTNVPAYSTPSVAQHVIACALDFTNKIHRQSAAVRDGAWLNSPDFCCFPERTTEVANSIFVVIGGGATGTAVATAAGALGADVRVVSARNRPALDDALAAADFVSLHIPLAAETERLVDASFLSRLKPSCCFLCGNQPMRRGHPTILH